MKIHNGIPVFGDADENTLQQIYTCSYVGDVAGAALMADAHLGYSMPIGGVVAYRNMISPTGVGYDIGCGNAAVRTNLTYDDIRADLPRIMDEIESTVSFGLGSTGTGSDHPIFDHPNWDVYDKIKSLKRRAQDQLGSVGAGNHYVDLFIEVPFDISSGRVHTPHDSLEALQPFNPPVWIANHFGSRGLGHKIASGFINMAQGYAFNAPVPKDDMMAAPTLLPLDTSLGETYRAAMELAGDYAKAGRQVVIDQVLSILKAKPTKTVNSHHNYAWEEEHNGERVWVVRKGATPIRSQELAYIGGSMCDFSAIVEGVEHEAHRASLASGPHGSGRIMSRSKARGKVNRKTGEIKKAGLVSPQMMHEAITSYGLELRGGDLDESPFVYRKLLPVLESHDNLIIRHVLRPIGVAMAPARTFDPFID